MESEQLSDKDFANRVGISAGTLSNIMGGRNNPSLDVMTRILNVFRTISADWLILGVGPMYRSSGGSEVPELIFQSSKQDADEQPAKGQDVPMVGTNAAPAPQRRVEKIVVFYTDGTFEER